MIGDNAPAPDGWKLPRRCCGTWCEGLSCTVCGNWLPTPALIVRGEN